ncbi:Uncharacterized protein SCF082_LOCUS547 [Durusdinium trenchii]|uniref:Uncharacterized protein n=1 Tax=Durusdinium trenchii TaxID=1381693 RepID=A0ABP0H8B2_9DINO
MVGVDAWRVSAWRPPVLQSSAPVGASPSRRSSTLAPRDPAVEGGRGNKTCGDLQNRRTWDESGKKEGTDVHPEIPQDPATQTSRTSRTSQLNGRHWSLPEDPSGSPLDGVHGVRTQLLGQIRNPDETGISIEIILSRSMAVLAQFVDQGNFLLVAFDAALAAWNGTDLGEEIPCSEFFTPTTVAELGDRAACIQGSPQHLLVRLGFGASLGEAATAVFVLDTARQYQQINSPVEVSRVFEFPAQRLFLGPALGETSNFVKPTVILRGPTVWGQCGDLHLDGSFSLGSTGRPWKLIRWRCTGDGSSCAKIVGYLPNSCDQQTPLETTGLAVGPVPCGLRATIPEAVASDLTISLATLEIHLKLENAMGLWDEAVHRIRFTVDRVPMVSALSRAKGGELVQVLVSLVSLLWLWRFVFLAGSHKWRFVEWIEQEFPVDPNSRGSCMANIG